MTLPVPEEVPDYWLEPKYVKEHVQECGCWDCHENREHDWRDWEGEILCEWCKADKKEWEASQ